MKFQLIKTTCRRCEKPLTTGSRSLFGADELKAKLDRICADCITPEENQEMTYGYWQATSTENLAQ